MLDGASGSATDGSTVAPETSSSFSQHTTQSLKASIRSSATMNAPPNGAYVMLYGSSSSSSSSSRLAGDWAVADGSFPWSPPPSPLPGVAGRTGSSASWTLRFLAVSSLASSLRLSGGS
eukprot:7389021-Prymnesium_polylepis.1